jgi:hypothetical protein
MSAGHRSTSSVGNRTKIMFIVLDPCRIRQVSTSCGLTCRDPSQMSLFGSDFSLIRPQCLRPKLSIPGEVDGSEFCSERPPQLAQSFLVG